MGIKIGIIGATGAVGAQMVECLEERALDIDELRVFASEKSAGKKILCKGREWIVETVKEDSFKGLDYVLGATSNALAKQYRQSIVDAGAVFIDNSSAFRLEEDVPLVVPTINPEDAKMNHGVIANPNCSTIIALTAIAVVNKLSKVKTVHASTYQAVSGAGVGGMKELEEQISALEKGEEIKCSTFAHQIAYNVLPVIGDLLANGYTKEEMKMQNEGRKILHSPDLLVDCTCVRVPVMRSHSITVSLLTEEKVELDVLSEAFKNAPGIILKEMPAYPMPLSVSNSDLVEVGRIRKDLTDEKGISFFCAGDQIRRGAAANAIDIMELLVK